MSRSETPEALRERLWKEIEKAHVVMLGLVGGEPRHMQPMAAFPDEKAGAVWFFTNKSTDLHKEAGERCAAMMCVMAADKTFQACVTGELSPDADRAKIDEFWSAYVSAWFPGGKDDPGLALMRFSPDEARVWASTSGALGFAYQIVKANVSKTPPDVGVVADVDL